MKIVKKFLYTAIFTLFVSILYGCPKVGPEYVRPELNFEVNGAYQNDLSEAVEELNDDKWWEEFNDPYLNEMVEKVLKNNPDIKKAVASVLELESVFVQTKAESFPEVNLNANRSRSQNSVATVLTTTDEISLTLPVSYELDLWGRIARSKEAAIYNLLQSKESLMTVAQTIVAETVSLYLQLESLERRIQIKKQTIKNYEHSLLIITEKYERGLSSILDVSQTKRILSQTKSELPELKQELGIAQQNLSVLLGQYPKTSPPRDQPEDYYNRLKKIPGGLRSDLLKRRPDIRAQEANLIKLNAEVGIARANRFPTISLTSNLGYSSDELGELFTGDSFFWSLASGILQPIFRGNALKAAQKAAEARFKQGVVEYYKTVLTAFSEVEQALLKREKQLEKRKLFIDYLNEARITQKIAESRYKKGLVDYQEVLDAMRTRFTAEENLVVVDLSIFTNRVNLHKSLGGGWGI
jgi:outer membrane protein, multidrug efflux system